MNHRRNAAWLAIWLCLSLCVEAAVKNGDIRITVVDSQTRSATIDNSGVEKNCDGVNYDAYCHNSKTVEITNLLLVREGDGPPFWVSCNVDTKWSRCVPLEKGRSFDARREKRGLTVYYEDDNGKARKQLYALVTPDGAAAPTAKTAPVAKQADSTPAENSKEAPVGAGVPASQDTVKCSFQSTPPGAEITIDGRFVGSTPSVVGVSAGAHVVLVTLPGFAQWKRDLTVAAESELTVNAILEKEK